MKRARVIAAHRAPERPAIRVAPGDAVTLGERDRDWPEFVWTTLASGLGVRMARRDGFRRACSRRSKTTIQAG